MADLAADCVQALRERGLYGDGDLADQLDAGLGTAALPRRKLLPVDLDEVWHRAVSCRRGGCRGAFEDLHADRITGSLAIFDLPRDRYPVVGASANFATVAEQRASAVDLRSGDFRRQRQQLHDEQAADGVLVGIDDIVSELLGPR